MFTGIVQQVGRVAALDRGRLTIAGVDNEGEPWIIGESIAVNGCCLTLVPGEGGLCFDISEETMRRTALGDFRIGTPVNVERAMKAGERFGGHIVQGHVDEIGTLVSIEGERFTFEIAPGSERYLIDKGSISIDGISLTVVEPVGNRFSVAIIPHTLAQTNLAHKREGDHVNLEFDVIAKHVEKLLAFR